MWKVLLLLACVASYTIVYCDDSEDSSNDDSDGVDINYGTAESSGKSSKSSSSSSSSSSLSSLSTTALKSLKSSQSSSSISSLSSSESSAKKITDYTSKKRQKIGGDYDAHSSSIDASGSANIDTTAQGSTEEDASDGSVSQSCVKYGPAYKCGPNQVFSNCTNGGCDARYCSQAGKPVPCVKLDPKNCIKGCVCQPGYLRTKDGNCVLKNQCKEGCGGDPHAHPGCGVNCGKTCEKRRICPRICKVDGCDCNDNFFLDSNVGRCVAPQKCTPTCGLNEEYSSCINGGCGYKNCSQIGQPKLCVDPVQGSCIKGCVCASGYLRHANGTCILQEHCPKTGCKGDPNAHPGCGVNCGRTCSTYKNKNVACPAICYPNGCDCNKGLVYDDIAKKCVAPKDCRPAYKCGPNQVFSNCTNGGCDARYCSQAGKPVPCVKLDPKNCIKGCVCQPGYLRTKEGNCVLKNECKEGCNGDPKAHPGCGVNCGRTCSTYKRKHVACPAICNLNGCDCNDGLVYDDVAGKCVAPKDCRPAYKCGPNQVFSNCTNGGCDARYCSQAGKPVPCVKLDPKNCIKGCVCQPGYLRTKEGNCVLKNECKEGCNGDPKAHPGCGVNCGRTCSTYKRKHVACPAICNLNGCDCNDGLVYDDVAGKCVAPKDCSGCGGDPNAKPGCGYNCGKTCSTYKINKRLLCPRIVCKPDKCDCKDGYVLDKNLNECVMPQECTPTCGPNEVYSTCTNGGCGHRNCSQLGKPEICIKRTPESCTKGCICAADYLRAENGTCVPRNQCPASGCGGDPNAKPGCGLCRSTCSTYKFNKTLLCPRIVCKPDKCDCKDGFVLDKNLNKCVWPQQCTPTCGPNEVYSTCTNGGCGHRNCSQLGKPEICIDRTPESCTKGCICAEDYLRAKNGTCVPRNQCPVTKCNGDPNAHPGCGVNCGRTCDTYKKKDVACILICNVNGCDCNDGYVYDKVDKRCVLPKDCSKKCDKPNEVYDPCIWPCPPRRCDVDDSTIRCAAPPKLGDPSCQSGCRCADGYARNATGTCVHRDQCEKPLTCNRPNEIYAPCGAPCPGDSCKVNPAAVLCTPGPNYGDPTCKPACRCIDGYARNASNYCIPRDQCPTPTNDQCRGQNEFFDKCISGCSNQTCDSIGKIYNCPIQPAVCKTGCRCKPGFYRNGTNFCVPESECRCKNDPNAHPGCGVNCGRTCDTYKKKDVACILICNVNGCDCNNGYVYDKVDKRCVLPKDCSKKCDKPNEVYDPCIWPCPPRRCDVDDSTIRCAAPPKLGDPSCQSGCRCADGYARNATGSCVHRDQCEKPLTCDRPNEIYASCGPPCPGDSCKVNPAVVLCLPGPNYGDPACKPACKCIDGYARNTSNDCIPRDQCPTPTDDQCPGQNEFFDNCISGCSNQSCDSIGKIYNCPIQPAVCRTGCRCKPGFYRNGTNVCVAESECPTPPCPKGEIYSRCPTVKCDGDYCPKDRNSRLTCPVGIVCDPPRCVCGFNSHRDRKTGKCIATANCPPFKCDGPHEMYKPCPPVCPGENCADYINSSRCPPFRIGIVVPCKPECKCIDGYYRNSSGICILGAKCGPKATTQSPIIVTTTNKPPTITTCTTTKDNNDGAGNALANLKAGVTIWTGKFLYDRMEAGKGQNIIASPYSVFTPMVQLGLRATGECLKQITSLLNVSGKEEIRSAFPALTSSYAGQTSVNFTIAAKMYTTSSYPLNETFKKESADIASAEVEEVNFSENTQAAEEINAWVESKTNNRIKDLINPSDLSDMTVMVLVNAIYFKGQWLKSFKKDNTKEADFYLSDGTTKKTKLMYQQGLFNYGAVPELNLEVLQMFYKGGNFSMVIVLPKEKDGAMQAAKNLRSTANFNKVMGSLRSEQVNVYIPPFEINTETDLAVILKQEGVTKIFDPKDSGLTGLLMTEKPIYVSKAIQKAYIKVDEFGTEAAAANAVIIGVTSVFNPNPPKEIIFRCDRNFLFYLKFQDTILFGGTVVNPN